MKVMFLRLFKLAKKKMKFMFFETGTYIRSVFNNNRGISTQPERIHVWDTDGYVQDNGWEFGCVIIARILLQEKYK